METPIGRELREHTWRWVVALLIGLVVVGMDLWLQWRSRVAADAYVEASAAFARQWGVEAEDPGALLEQAAVLNVAYAKMTAAGEATRVGWASLALLTAFGYFFLARCDRVSIGFVETPAQGWRPWCGVAWRIGLVVLAVALPLAVLWRFMGWEWGGAWETASNWQWEISVGLIGCPIFEELIYRLAVCVPLAARFGAWPAILVSGVLFALLHVAYGVQNPINAVAGFLFAWTFLKSGTILVPIVLHSLGNLIGYSLLQIAAASGLQPVLS